MINFIKNLYLLIFYNFNGFVIYLKLIINLLQMFPQNCFKIAPKKSNTNKENIQNNNISRQLLNNSKILKSYNDVTIKVIG